MSAIVYSVAEGSLAKAHKIAPGNVINKINGVEVFDILEYKFLVSDKKVKLDITDNGRHKKVVIKNNFQDLGIEFENPLIDKARSCQNKCVFCFIDQLPKGMRDTLYFKDDDSRLSFLHGNYVTLTNMSMEDVKRLAKIRVSPINISVQTTNPHLRCKMLNNRFAGDLMDKMKYLAKHKIVMNCQIVLCPTLNDMHELKRSLMDLSELYPYAASISAVPVGVTKFRDGLYPITTFDRERLRKNLEIISEMQEYFLKKLGTRLVYAGDEMYLGSGLDIPSAEEYEGFPQIENGVGMIASFEDEFYSALRLESARDINKTVSIATGVAAFDVLKKASEAAMEKFNGLKINVYKIYNDFFGRSITVSGLLTATDMINQLEGRELGEKLFISQNALKADEDIFLDDMTLSDFEKKLGVSVVCVNDAGYDLLDKILEN